MKRQFIPTFAAALIVCSAGAAAASTAATFHGHELVGQAKLTLIEARAVALKARPGKIIDQELEREGGGSGLRYSFDVRSHSRTIEVGVDAMTGKILENGAENATKEAKEAAQEGMAPKR